MGRRRRPPAAGASGGISPWGHLMLRKSAPPAQAPGSVLSVTAAPADEGSSLPTGPLRAPNLAPLYPALGILGGSRPPAALPGQASVSHLPTVCGNWLRPLQSHPPPNPGHGPVPCCPFRTLRPKPPQCCCLGPVAPSACLCSGGTHGRGEERLSEDIPGHVFLSR